MKRARRVLLVIPLSLAMFLVAGLGLFRTISSGPQPAVAGDGARAVSDRPGIAAATLTQAIANLQARLKALPTDWRSFATLGMAYVHVARVTADPSYYPKAEAVLRRSLDLMPRRNFEAMTGMAALAAARHDFTGSLAWGDRARQVNPYNANVYAVIGDAQVELGRYEDAFATFQKMIDLKPSLSTYARVSYAWELQGGTRNSVRAMNLALQSAASPSDGAWARNQIGELYWNSGDLARAEHFYRSAVEEDPAFVPPHAGLAKVQAARGLLTDAIKGYSWVVQRFPLPEYVIALGDLYSVKGEKELAAQQYELVHVEERLLQANGVNIDLEIALFDADHHVDLAKGLAAARAEWARRTSIHVADALAWELYANGRLAEALRYANLSLRLGTRNALFLFHRGMIERALGRTAAARRDLATAVSINPHFSTLWSKRALDLVEKLGGAP
jgi:tetratricopeptide (TPR) repeat protein